MKALELFAIGLFLLVLVLVYRMHLQDAKVNQHRSQLDSLNAAYKLKFRLYDSLTKIEPLIIEQHNHNTKKYYENHYTIIAANDSATKNSLFSNLERYSYLHNLPPSKNNQPHN